MLNRWLNPRALVSLSILLCLIVMLVTSVLMFAKNHYMPVAMLHTVLGFSLLLFAILHLKNNFSPLKSYLSLKFWGKTSRYKASFPLVLFLGASLIGLSWYGYGPIKRFYQWGMELRVADTFGDAPSYQYIVVDKTDKSLPGQELTIELKTGTSFLWPQYAIWLETMEGELVQPLYVTSKLAKNNFENRVTQLDESTVFKDNPFNTAGFKMEDAFNLVVEPESKSERVRPESLPVFLHQLGIRDEEGQFVTHGENLIPDAYTGATMSDNFVYRTKLERVLSGKFRLKLEMNQSFDFNQYYSSDRFPSDPIYSGSGFSAQPSVVYETTLDFDNPERLYLMGLAGRGHHSGQDGDIHSDLSGMDSALSMIDRLIVEVH
ncbi:DUF4405 domain-containing protein [Shewanella nanhaiensis]|uniref:DUF4405 domain-containing protein n=1 Tax=Shewanella nanhaiensis TaxID=2864872 RepID=A0ABS7E8G1_9GAMM|nr:DUF4405 domain-containing protein [Shewanella nanhaiensis]MBW8185973.1 DUF4405 domain-containing protein [Shewanella nanhaiensis]